MNEIVDKNPPYETSAEFCQLSDSVLENGVQRKIAFEIY